MLHEAGLHSPVTHLLASAFSLIVAGATKYLAVSFLLQVSCGFYCHESGSIHL